MHSNGGVVTLIDGGFEDRSTLNQPGFGWQTVPSSQVLHISLDQIDPNSGTTSLRLDWSGTPNSSSAIVTQLVLVQPNAHYRLQFTARTHELVTAGPPLVMVLDASSAADLILGKASVMPQGSSSWQQYSVDFTTGQGTQAVQISVQRQSCSGPPCPIFGQVWLDDFALQKI